MFQVGERLTALVPAYVIYGDCENWNDMVQITGTYEFTTDDPDEYIQDVAIRTDDGNIVYIDEQDIRRV
jgi:hypothetical protein